MAALIKRPAARPLRATARAPHLYSMGLRGALTKERTAGTMTLAGGQITSAAMDYANALSPTIRRNRNARR